MRVPTYATLSDPLAPAKPGERSLDISIALYNHFEPKQSVITEHFIFTNEIKLQVKLFLIVMLHLEC